MNKKDKWSLWLISGLSTVLFLVPFYIMIANSFKTKKEIFMNTLSLPSSFQLSNYLEAWSKMDFLQVFLNSLTVTVGSLVLVIIFSSMAAWMLQRTDSKVSTFIFYLFVSAMLVPFQAVMLPLVRIMGNLNLLNMPGLIFMYLGFQSCLSIFLYHGFVKGIPRALDEASIIDGCNTFQTFWYVIFPLLKPITVTVAVLNAVWIWNDYLLPSLVINEEASHTIPLRIFFFFGEYTKQWHLAMAGLTLAIIPVIIFYFFAQKHIIKGVTDGSVK
jgi:raffinose/stachyose/melibiose transport system permease protein